VYKSYILVEKRDYISILRGFLYQFCHRFDVGDVENHDFLHRLWKNQCKKCTYYIGYKHN